MWISESTQVLKPTYNYSNCIKKEKKRSHVKVSSIHSVLVILAITALQKKVG